MQSPSSGLGLQLQRAREARGLTIADVAAATRISERALQAIERDRFHLLPAGIFRRIWAYAQAVGLDGPACVGAYRQHFEAMERTGDHENPPIGSVRARNRYGHYAGGYFGPYGWFGIVWTTG